MAAIAEVNAIRQSLGGSVQILTPGKVGEIFHSDWTAHDRRLAAALGWQPRWNLTEGFAETILWYRRQGWL
jgi:2-alkyl-3-oxoalkanoate reductase